MFFWYFCLAHTQCAHYVQHLQSKMNRKLSLIISDIWRILLLDCMNRCGIGTSNKKLLLIWWDWVVINLLTKFYLFPTTNQTFRKWMRAICNRRIKLRLKNNDDKWHWIDNINISGYTQNIYEMTIYIDIHWKISFYSNDIHFENHILVFMNFSCAWSKRSC